MAATILDLTNVQKTYKGKVEALRGISLQVAEGSIFGLLGPNGAGKSTLVKILTTIIHPTRCEGTMLGYPVGHKPILRQVGYLPGACPLPGLPHRASGDPIRRRSCRGPGGSRTPPEPAQAGGDGGSPVNAS